MLNDFRVEINLIKVFIKQMHIYIYRLRRDVFKLD